MPSTRPQAAFEPLAPGVDIRNLVESTPNFEWAIRIHCDMVSHHGPEQFERLVLMHVILGGKPLIVEGYENKLDKWTFSAQWLRDNWGLKVVDARDLTAGKNVPLTIQHYLNHMALLTNQWDEKNYKDKDRQRMYLKDIDCHPIWADKVKDQIPFGLFYFNESVGDLDGLGAVDENTGTVAAHGKGRGAAKAGDLMSSLPKEMRAENLMCYIGHEGTFTPTHREMCATLGHNIMVEASTAGVENGKLTKPGSSIWFMTETKDREVVSEYWLSRLGHDIEIEKHFAQVNAWKQAPFKVWVVEQKVGDFILIPPLAPHQVWNRGTRTMKVAWNRTTVETLEMALNEALPKARMVCRDEQYKNKAIVFYTLKKYSHLLRAVEKQKKQGFASSQSDYKVRQLQKDFKRLQTMFSDILLSESFFSDRLEENAEMVPFDSNITCSYCRCNIFNRFLTCPNCVGKLPNGEDDTYDICIECYAMGRSCACISKLRWAEQWHWSELTAKHEQWRRQIIEIDGKVDPKLPKSLNTELGLLGKRRTLAQICQIELARRPFHDIKKDNDASRVEDDIEREEIDEVDANGNVRKKKKIRRSEKYIREHGRCHVDCYWEPKWKQASCSKCDKNYCYGNLYRAYDELPQEIMADPKWKCPSCRSICGCRHCRHKPGFKQYVPKGTLLGHNTKAVADPRSVESLVDFSYPNIGWIQKAGDDHEEDTLRLRRRLRQAEAAKAKEPQLTDHYVDNEVEESESVENRLLQLADQEGIPIDPALGFGAANRLESTDSIGDEEAFIEHPEELWWEANLVNDNDPQALVPEGGIMWDNEHAYDTTDAITYVYPDLVPTSSIPPAPAEGFTPMIIPGYEPAETPTSSEKIEMVVRKRKHAKFDEGDRPYAYKKAKSKPKARKSLVLKLAIDGQRLRKFADQSVTAELVETETTAPMIGSDLQALNLDYHLNESAPVALKDANDNPDKAVDTWNDNDDDFTPSRYRDRRKPNADGAPRSPPGAEITRRTTRTQTVRYTELEEDEFDEEVRPLDKGSKLVTMQEAIRDAMSLPTSAKDLGVLSKTGKRADTSTSPLLSPETSSSRGLSAEQAADSALSVPRLPRTLASQKINKSKPVVPLPIAREKPNESGQLSTAPTPSTRTKSKLLADAEANKRAKLATLNGMLESDAESASDEDGSTERSSLPAHALPTIQKPADKLLVKSTASRDVLPATRHPSLSRPAPTGKLKPSIGVKIAAADWSDDSSDEELNFVKPASKPRSGTGFAAVNGRVGHHITQPTVRGSPSGRRGRPAIHR